MYYYNGRQTKYRDPRKCVYVGSSIYWSHDWKTYNQQKDDCNLQTLGRWTGWTWSWDDTAYYNEVSNYECPLVSSPFNPFTLSHHKVFWNDIGMRPPEYYEW